jgi:diguanylate cyclase (GGDEF)-like protein
MILLLLPGNSPGQAKTSSPALFFEQPANLPPARFPFRTYGAENGLENLAVRRIDQDPTGFLWVGTEDGLYRYEGDRFVRIGLANGLPSTWIADFISTPEGELWVCTTQGLAKGRGDRFRAIDTAKSGLPPGPCSALARDAEGTIWVAHAEGLFHGAGDQFVRFESWAARDVTAVCALPPPATGLVAGGDGEIAIIESRQVRKHMAPASGWKEPIDSIAVDGAGAVWVQTARRIFRLAAGEDRFRDEGAGLAPVSSRGLISTDRSGRLWVPTDEGAGCRIGDGWRHLGTADGLPTDWSRCVFEDREHSLWVGSLGLHRLVGRGAWASWTRADGLPSDTVWDVRRTRRGDLWVATDKGLCRATPKGWRVLKGTERTVVRRLHEDSAGRLWLGLVPAGVLLHDPDTGNQRSFGPAEGVTGRRVLSIEEDASGQLWAATDGGGLLRFRRSRQDFVREDVPEGAPHETFRFLCRDRKGRILATGERGLLVRDGNRWKRFTRRDGLLRDHVSYVTEDAQGDFWLSYFDPVGVARIRFAGDKLQILAHLDASRGLSSGKVYLLGIDRAGRLWVGSGKGLDVFSADGVVHFSKSDGLAGDDVDAMAIHVESDGSVFIGTSSGLSLNRGDGTHRRPAAPKPVILGATLGSLSLASERRDSPAVPYYQNTLFLRFASLSFLNEQQLEYEVRFSGVDAEWRRVRTGEVLHPSLRPGNYRFEARARLGQGPWSEPAAISFEIRPPWWDLWPARIGIALIALGVVAGGFRWRIRRLRQRTLELESLVEARTRELAAANSALERLSITDPLTGLKNRRFLELSISGDIARARRARGEERALGRQRRQESLTELVFFLIDLDHFKQVNDRFGHAAGDQVLQQMGGVLSSAVRETDTVVRWGGEEFLVLARESRVEDAPLLAERIRTHVEQTEFALSGRAAVRLTCSIGFASCPLNPGDGGAIDWEATLRLADRCLYASKHSGRNAWVGLRAVGGNDGPGLGSPDEIPSALESGRAEVSCRLHPGSTLRWS